MSTIRKNVVTLKGNQMDAVGPELKVGDVAPEFTLTDVNLERHTLANTAGKTRIILSLPSFSTSVCAQETKRFNDEVAKLTHVEVLAVSRDLPFTQKNWCGAEGVTNVRPLSAFRDTHFGTAYGVQISGGAWDQLFSRAVFVVGGDNKIKYVEYVKEISEQPNFEAVLAAAR